MTFVTPQVSKRLYLCAEKEGVCLHLCLSKVILLRTTAVLFLMQNLDILYNVFLCFFIMHSKGSRRHHRQTKLYYPAFLKSLILLHWAERDKEETGDDFFSHLLLWPSSSCMPSTHMVLLLKIKPNAYFCLHLYNKLWLMCCNKEIVSDRGQPIF